MKFKTISALLVCTSLLLSGCGYVRNTYVSDQDIKEKTAFALDVPVEHITIIDKDPGLSDIKYTVQIKGQTKTKQCYFTTILATDSQAVCAGTSNPLTK
ncbi:hypothetical protein [Zophobihabitans entericus]|uniref:Lipoprotein n=1 Tax=Zophobihabitans entericus TaxID=1635327 RepID=A0A6G9IEH3_9GAMM|nr:hypothetical protein [Zophobihabitans entericus]QIQ22209.1 hypothetical protein IPMB12_11225 [Zophobihabitans entericus]